MTTPTQAPATDALDPPQTVRVGGQEVVWRIARCLTDRRGNINKTANGAPALAALQADAALLERLRAQMWDEFTFVARVDGQFGVLYEREVCTNESDPGLPLAFVGQTEPFPSVQDATEQADALLAELAARFPEARFALAPAETQFRGRLGLWAFVPDGAMPDAGEREALGMAMLRGQVEPKGKPH